MSIKVNDFTIEFGYNTVSSWLSGTKIDGYNIEKSSQEFKISNCLLDIKVVIWKNSEMYKGLEVMIDNNNSMPEIYDYINTKIKNNLSWVQISKIFDRKIKIANLNGKKEKANEIKKSLYL